MHETALQDTTSEKLKSPLQGFPFISIYPNLRISLLPSILSLLPPLASYLLEFRIEWDVNDQQIQCFNVREN